ncbi:unnamed protein product [Closterium sp. NIES-53]
MSRRPCGTRATSTLPAAAPCPTQRPPFGRAPLPRPAAAAVAARPRPTAAAVVDCLALQQLPSQPCPALQQLPSRTAPPCNNCRRGLPRPAAATVAALPRPALAAVAALPRPDAATAEIPAADAAPPCRCSNLAVAAFVRLPFPPLLQGCPRESLTSEQLREWYACWDCRGGHSGSRPGVGGSGASGSGQVQLQRRPREALLPSSFSAALGDGEATALGACTSPAPGAGEAAALGAGESTDPGVGESALSGTAPAAVLHTFTLDSGASRSFFRDSTTLTPLSRPVAVSLADPSGGPVLAHSSTVLPCPAAPSGLLSGLHLPSFSTNLVSGADLQDAWVDQFTPGGQRVTLCTCSRMGRHLATFTRRPGSSLYTRTTTPPPVSASGQVAASSQVFATASRSSPASAPCSCRPLSHKTLLWHHRIGHPSLPRLRGMASRSLVSGLPRSLPPLPPGPAPTCVPCVEGRQRAAPHSSSFPPTKAPLQTLHMDVWGPARVRGQGHERYFLLVVDDYSHPTEPVEVAVDSGASRGAEPAGAGTGGAETGGAESGGAETGGAEPGGAEFGHVLSVSRRGGNSLSTAAS